MSPVPNSHSNAMRLKPQRTQSGFVISGPSSVKSTTSCSPAAGAGATPAITTAINTTSQERNAPGCTHDEHFFALPKYEPLYVLSYGALGTRASDGHWCVVLADEVPYVLSVTRQPMLMFSVHGLCRGARATGAITRAAKDSETLKIDEATGKKRRRVRFQDESNQPVRVREKQRRMTHPLTDKLANCTSTSTTPCGPIPTSPSFILPGTSDLQVPNEVRKAPLRPTTLPLERVLKPSVRLLECIQQYEPTSLTPGYDYKFEDTQDVVLGLIEIAQLPLNFVDTDRKHVILNRLKLEVSRGTLGGKDLDATRREWVVRIVNDLTGAWRVGCRDLPMGVTATVQTVARLFDSQSD